MKIAVIIPCLNESSAIGRVVKECQAHLPDATIYVLDNDSDDNTAEIALQAGAHVIISPLRGKGNVIRHAFRILEADYYVMIDGDGTYPIAEAKKLIEVAHSFNYEMVMGSRLKLGVPEAFRPLHYTGNRLLTGLVRFLFGFPVQDLLTGFRVFSHRFAREVPLTSKGFEIETELTIRAMCQDLPFCEVPIPYGERDPGGKSKLKTFRDGWRILLTILRHFALFRPALSFGSIGLILVGASTIAPHAVSFPIQLMGSLLAVSGLVLAQIRMYLWLSGASKAAQNQSRQGPTRKFDKTA
ncbi:MAG: glycosyltransferase [Bdellovibrionales bacterium]